MGRLLLEVLDLLEETPARRVLCSRLEEGSWQRATDGAEVVAKVIPPMVIARDQPLGGMDDVMMKKKRAHLDPLAVGVVIMTTMCISRRSSQRPLVSREVCENGVLLLRSDVGIAEKNAVDLPLARRPTKMKS